jgi:dTDP-4-dehydrorhamnose 3,5-epimerase-like enzyme
MSAKLMRLRSNEDQRGALIALEGEPGREIPFNIKRVYYIFNTKPDERRGCHAHRRLQQLLVAVSGRCSVLVDDGVTKEEFRLDDPRLGLYMGPGNWRELYSFTPDCVLLVLASEHYDEDDYIRDYEAFRASAREVSR